MFKRLLASKHVQHRIRWIMGLLAATLIIPLVLFFHSSRAAGPGGPAGEIYGRQVPWEDFQAEYRVVSNYFQQQLGTDVSLEMFEPMLRAQTWDRLLLRAEARRRIRISNDDLAQFIRSQPTFQQEGAFSQDLYYRFIRATGQTPQYFEQRLRDDLQLERLIDSLNTQVVVTDEDVRGAYAKEYERMRAALVVFNGADFRAQVEPLVTEEQLRAFYDAQQETLRIPATRTIAYLGLSLTEEQTTNEAERKRLTETALDLQQDLDEKRSFEDIAAARNLPIRSVGPIAADATDLPDGLTSQMIQAAFDVEPNDTTGLLGSETGVFILKPTAEIPSRLPPFEELREDLRQRLFEQQGRAAALTRAKQARQEFAVLREGGKSLDEACALLGVPLMRPAEPFTQQGPIAGLDGGANVPAALFRLAVGELSETLPTSTGAVFGVVEERLPFDEEQFAKDRDTYNTTVLERLQQQRLTEYLHVLRAKARLRSYLEKK